MTYLEIENQVKQLPAVEQILLAEKMMHWLREAALPTPDFNRAEATPGTKRFWGSFGAWRDELSAAEIARNLSQARQSRPTPPDL
jgi:hypothetical protein